MLIVILLFCGMTVQAQDNEKKEPSPYMSARHLPNMLKWLPAPPDTTSEEFVHDIMRYMWGKKQRLNPERAAIAIRDAVDKFFARISCRLEWKSQQRRLQISTTTSSGASRPAIKWVPGQNGSTVVSVLSCV